jgi:transketolase
MPADPNQTDRIVRYIATQPGNFFVGMGRSKMGMITREDGSVFFDADYAFTPGKADWLRHGTDATIIAYGSVTPACMEAWQILKDAGKSVGVLNMASLLPLDVEAVVEAAGIGPIVTVEDHHIDTGLGASVATALLEQGATATLKRLGVKYYGGSGKPADLYKQQGLDGVSIAGTVEKLV